MAKIDWSKHNYHNDVHSAVGTGRRRIAYEREVEWSKLKFGKHKGKTLKQVPINYLRWIVSTWLPNSKMAKATINNAQHEITQRQSIASTTTGTKVANPKISVQDAN